VSEKKKKKKKKKKIREDGKRSDEMWSTDKSKDHQLEAWLRDEQYN